MSARIAPDGHHLEFVRNTRTGRVHIPPWMAGEPHDVTSAEQFVEALLARTSMLCGTALMIGPGEDWPAVHVAGDEFADDDLCIACVKALSEDQWRAFHRDNRDGSS